MRPATGRRPVRLAGVNRHGCMRVAGTTRACGHVTAWVQDRVTAAVGAAEILCNPIASDSLHRHLRAAGTESSVRTVERPSPVAMDGRGDRVGSNAALHRLHVLLDMSSPPSSVVDARVLPPPLSIANPSRHASAARGGSASNAMRPTYSEACSDDSLEEGDSHSRTAAAARPSAPMTQKPSASPWQRDLMAVNGGGGVRASESVPTISQPRSTAKAKRDTSLDVPSFVRSASTPHGRSACTERDEFSPSSRPTPDGARTFHLLLLMMRNREYSPALITALGSRTFKPFPSVRWRFGFSPSLRWLARLSVCASSVPFAAPRAFSPSARRWQAEGSARLRPYAPSSAARSTKPELHPTV
jgi:hypothetical protein